QAGVEAIPVEPRNVAAQSGVPGARLHLPANQFTVLGELRSRSTRQMTFAVQLEQPVERGPAEYAGVRVVPFARTRLPNPLIGPLPVPADELTEGAEHPARLAIEISLSTNELRRRVDDLAVHVELQLIHRGIADSYWPRTAVSGEMIDDPFGVRLVSVYVVEDAELGLRQPCRLQQPADEPLGFFGVTEPEERAHGQ